MPVCAEKGVKLMVRQLGKELAPVFGEILTELDSFLVQWMGVSLQLYEIRF